MKRQPIKTTSNEELRFIPSMYKKGYDIKSKDIYKRPLVICGQRLKREDRYELDSMKHVKWNVDPKENFKDLQPGDIDIIGMGKASKFVWDKCVTKVLNVIEDKEGKVKTYDEYKDTQSLWDGVGMDVEIAEAVEYFLNQSKLDEVEAKN